MPRTLAGVTPAAPVAPYESVATTTRVTNVLLFAGFDLAAVPPGPLYINSHPDGELREEEEVPSDREGTERH